MRLLAVPDMDQKIIRVESFCSAASYLLLAEVFWPIYNPPFLLDSAGLTCGLLRQTLRLHEKLIARTASL